ncbi:hypothetical protein C4546_04130 [Candidatus Parcubacteria bacterium]|jgi:hypothetical protein|nr:MAG: hypothetical protein C4546_04130 [Candidatus Parcubacteria bacterium]
MSHSCQAIVFTCIDFRFHSAIRDFLVSNSLKDNYDLVSLAGVTKGLVEGDKACSEIILKQIDISHNLHGIKEVLLIHHLDCGAYGGHKAFDSLAAEGEKQAGDLAYAKELIQAKFPNLDVKKVIARIQEKGGENLIDFEELS